MFVDVFIYTLCTGVLGLVLYIFHVFFQLLRYKKNIQKHWSYVDVLYHHTHQLLLSFFSQSKGIEDIQSHIKNLSQAHKQVNALSKKVEITGNLSSPFFQERVKEEQQLRSKLKAFLHIFHKAPDSEIKNSLFTHIEKLEENLEKEEECKKNYNEAVTKFSAYSQRFTAKKLMKKLKLSSFAFIP